MKKTLIATSIKGIAVVLFLFIVLLPAICLGIEAPEAVICANIQNRQPVNGAAMFPVDVGRVWCWCKIKDGQGMTIRHIYYHNGNEKAVVELPIHSQLFRTYSSKRIVPENAGQWRVDIVDANGNILKSLDFSIGEATQPEAPLAAEGQPS